MKGRRFKRILALFLLLPAFILTGCWQDSSGSEALQTEPSASSSSGKADENLPLPESLSLPYYPEKTLDPVTCPDGAQQTVAALLYEGLFELDQNLEPQEKLCSSFSYDAATLTWTFALRSGVMFSDGSALSADDVAATLRRAMSSDRYRSRLSAVKSVSAGSMAVVVELNTANTDLPALLDIPVVKSGTENNPVPIGTGPYVLVPDDSGAYLAVNGGWWGGNTQPVSRIGLVACGDSDAIRYQFTSHAVQLITADLTGENPVSATGSFSFHDADTTILQYVGFNLHSKWFSSAALRQALGLGIDRATVVSAYLSSHAKAAQFAISPVSKEYPSDLEDTYSYSAFETAMKTAGYQTGASRRVVMIVNAENSFKVSVARYLASALSAFDLDVEVRVLPWDEYRAALTSGSYDLYYGEVKLSADWDLRPLIGTGGSLNYGGFSDATLDLLLSEYASATDRAAAEKQICSYLKKQAPILPVCFKCTSVLSQAGVVGNLTPTAADPFYDLGTCAIHLAK
jgi:peptide/nickel transport system substrate-binding protein